MSLAKTRPRFRPQNWVDISHPGRAGPEDSPQTAILLNTVDWTTRRFGRVVENFFRALAYSDADVTQLVLAPCCS